MRLGVKTITTGRQCDSSRSVPSAVICVGIGRHDRQRSNGRRTCPRRPKTKDVSPPPPLHMGQHII
jgi:hypothetical protein